MTAALRRAPAPAVLVRAQWAEWDAIVAALPVPVLVAPNRKESVCGNYVKSVLHVLAVDDLVVPAGDRRRRLFIPGLEDNTTPEESSFCWTPSTTDKMYFRIGDALKASLADPPLPTCRTCLARIARLTRLPVEALRVHTP